MSSHSISDFEQIGGDMYDSEHAPAYLKFIEIENFKTYKGKNVFGPMKQFTVIFARGASAILSMSSFKDAMGFVLGEKESSFGVAKLSDLIHGADIGKPVADRVSVTMVYCDARNIETRFTRTLFGDTSEYWINDRVTEEDYIEELIQLGINPKVNNCVAYQEDIDTLAMKIVYDGAALLEKISGSGELRDEYDRLKEELTEAEDHLDYSKEVAKLITAEKKGGALDDAESIRQYKDLVEKRQVEFYLGGLYHCDKDLKRLDNDLKRVQSDLREVTRNKDELEEELREKKEEQGTCRRELAKIEHEICKADTQGDAKKLKILKRNCVTKKNEMKKCDQEVYEVQQRLSSVVTEVATAQQKLLSILTEINAQRGTRHGLLGSCLTSNIPIPLLEGNLEDVEPYGMDRDRDVYEKDNLIKVDFGQLSNQLKELSAEEWKLRSDVMQQEIHKMKEDLLPHRGLTIDIDSDKRYRVTAAEVENLRVKFEDVKSERRERFEKLLDHVSKEVAKIYKGFTGNQDTRVIFEAHNPEEPYFGNFNYCCGVPGEGLITPIHSLFGEQDTIATLALLVAIRSFQPGPFFVLGGIDGQLPQKYIEQVATFIRNYSKGAFQCIVLSQQSEFYTHADVMIGITPNAGPCPMSRPITLDLARYPDI